ncbi:CapE family protein [Priestia sp. HNGD-A6]|uniref:CapE family protein n=1 Tax=Priestia sp. HNGD-A6 TaxID=3092666 RepID=UPI00389299F2
MIAKRIVGIVGPIAIVAGVVAGLGALKHPATLSTDEQQKIENNVKMIEQTKSAATDAVNDAAAVSGK